MNTLFINRPWLNGILIAALISITHHLFTTSNVVRQNYLYSVRQNLSSTQCENTMRVQAVKLMDGEAARHLLSYLCGHGVLCLQCVLMAGLNSGWRVVADRNK